VVIRETGSIEYSMPAETAIERDARYIINVGSVGQPRDYDNRACYAVYDTERREFELRRIEYDIESKHYTEILSESIANGELEFTNEVPLKVTWHDSCHMGRAGGSDGIYEPPREVLTAIPGIEFVEMEHNREYAHCCGGVLSLLENPETAKIIGDVRLQEAVDTGAEALVASCPCCEVQFRVTAQKTNNDIVFLHL